ERAFFMSSPDVLGWGAAAHWSGPMPFGHRHKHRARRPGVTRVSRSLTYGHACATRALAIIRRMLPHANPPHALGREARRLRGQAVAWWHALQLAAQILVLVLTPSSYTQGRSRAVLLHMVHAVLP